jgi:SAM-dependent methyltransferase
MPLSRRLNDVVADRLPTDARRRLGRIKRAVLDRPEPAPAAPRQRKRQPPARRPTATAKAPEGQTRKDTRRDHVFATAPRDGVFLEIGPAHNGTLARRDGFDTRNVDYLDREGLVEKYKDFEQYDPADIEEVDYVLEAGAPFSKVIDERFDVVLASHVLEHTTSLVDFVNECSALLKPGGELALIVPDHRFCFDRFRERSSLARVIDASLDPPSVHTVGTLADFTLNAVRHRGSGSWAPGHLGQYSRIHEFEAVRANMTKATGPDYIDVHNWIFSPNHLRLLLQDLADLELISVRETHFHPTIGHEFFINLSPEGPGTGLTREQLMARADNEKRTLDKPDFA